MSSGKPLWNEWVLSNGLTFLYRQSPGVPLAAGTLLVRAGSLYERLDQAGLASLTAELMLQGTRRRSAQKIADDVESVGASIGIQASEDYTQLGYSAPVAQLDRILDVVAEILIQPAFSAPEIKKERAGTLAALKSRKDSIFNFTYDAFNQALFGSHPYSRPIDGLRETVERFTPADFKTWHRTYFLPDRTILAMVASLSPGEAKRQVEKRLGPWKKRITVIQENMPSVPLLRSSQNVRLKARFEQAYFMTGVFAPTVNDPDYITLKVLNTLLGSGMSSRLFLRLREEMGLAYEVSSFFSSHLLPSQWVFYLGTPPEKLPVAKKELERLLEVLKRKGPTGKEIQQAIAMIKGAYVMEHQTRRRQAWYAAWWKFLGRGPAPGEYFLREIEKITPSRAHALARKLLSQPRVTVEVVPEHSK